MQRKIAVSLKKKLTQVLSHLKSRPAATPFSWPVLETQVPDYHAIISQPMDLHTMVLKIDQYIETALSNCNSDDGSQNAEEATALASVALASDMNLIVSNCILYNGETHPLTDFARQLHAEFSEQMQLAGLQASTAEDTGPRNKPRIFLHDDDDDGDAEAKSSRRKKKKSMEQPKPLLDFLSDIKSEIMVHENSYYFTTGVSDDIAPGYSIMIAKPMDLTTAFDQLFTSLKDVNIDDGDTSAIIKSALQMLNANLKLILINSERYNGQASLISVEANELMKFCDVKMRQIRAYVQPKSIQLSLANLASKAYDDVDNNKGISNQKRKIGATTIVDDSAKKKTTTKKMRKSGANDDDDLMPRMTVVVVTDGNDNGLSPRVVGKPYISSGSKKHSIVSSSLPVVLTNDQIEDFSWRTSLSYPKTSSLSRPSITIHPKQPTSRHASIYSKQIKECRSRWRNVMKPTENNMNKMKLVAGLLMRNQSPDASVVESEICSRFMSLLSDRASLDVKEIDAVDAVEFICRQRAYMDQTDKRSKINDDPVPIRVWPSTCVISEERDGTGIMIDEALPEGSFILRDIGKIPMGKPSKDSEYSLVDDFHCHDAICTLGYMVSKPIILLIVRQMDDGSCVPVAFYPVTLDGGVYYPLSGTAPAKEMIAAAVDDDDDDEMTKLPTTSQSSMVIDDTLEEKVNEDDVTVPQQQPMPVDDGKKKKKIAKKKPKKKDSIVKKKRISSSSSDLQAAESKIPNPVFSLFCSSIDIISVEGIGNHPLHYSSKPWSIALENCERLMRIIASPLKRCLCVLNRLSIEPDALHFMDKQVDIGGKEGSSMWIRRVYQKLTGRLIMSDNSYLSSSSKRHRGQGQKQGTRKRSDGKPLETASDDDSNDVYNNVIEFAADVRRIWSWSLAHYQEGSIMHSAALSMCNLFEELFWNWVRNVKDVSIFDQAHGPFDAWTCLNCHDDNNYNAIDETCQICCKCCKDVHNMDCLDVGWRSRMIDGYWLCGRCLNVASNRGSSSDLLSVEKLVPSRFLRFSADAYVVCSEVTDVDNQENVQVISLPFGWRILAHESGDLPKYLSAHNHPCIALTDLKLMLDFEAGISEKLRDIEGRRQEVQAVISYGNRHGEHLVSSICCSRIVDKCSMMSDQADFGLDDCCMMNSQFKTLHEWYCRIPHIHTTELNHMSLTARDSIVALSADVHYSMLFPKSGSNMIDMTALRHLNLRGKEFCNPVGLFGLRNAHIRSRAECMTASMSCLNYRYLNYEEAIKDVFKEFFKDAEAEREIVEADQKLCDLVANERYFWRRREDEKYRQGTTSDFVGNVTVDSDSSSWQYDCDGLEFELCMEMSSFLQAVYPFTNWQPLNFDQVQAAITGRSKESIGLLVLKDSMEMKKGMNDIYLDEIGIVLTKLLMSDCIYLPFDRAIRVSKMSDKDWFFLTANNPINSLTWCEVAWKTAVALRACRSNFRVTQDDSLRILRQRCDFPAEKEWLMKYVDIISVMLCHPYSVSFSSSSSNTRAGSLPIDLLKIFRGLIACLDLPNRISHKYDSPLGIVQDMELLWKNSFACNDTASEIAKHAGVLSKLFVNLHEKWIGPIANDSSLKRIGKLSSTMEIDDDCAETKEVQLLIDGVEVLRDVDIDSWTTRHRFVVCHLLLNECVQTRAAIDTINNTIRAHYVTSRIDVSKTGKPLPFQSFVPEESKEGFLTLFGIAGGSLAKAELENQLSLTAECDGLPNIDIINEVPNLVGEISLETAKRPVSSNSDCLFGVSGLVVSSVMADEPFVKIPQYLLKNPGLTTPSLISDKNGHENSDSTRSTGNSSLIAPTVIVQEIARNRAAAAVEEAWKRSFRGSCMRTMIQLLEGKVEVDSGSFEDVISTSESDGALPYCHMQPRHVAQLNSVYLSRSLAADGLVMASKDLQESACNFAGPSAICIGESVIRQKPLGIDSNNVEYWCLPGHSMVLFCKHRNHHWKVIYGQQKLLDLSHCLRKGNEKDLHCLENILAILDIGKIIRLSQARKDVMKGDSVAYRSSEEGGLIASLTTCCLRNESQAELAAAVRLGSLRSESIEKNGRRWIRHFLLQERWILTHELVVPKYIDDQIAINGEVSREFVGQLMMLRQCTHERKLEHRLSIFFAALEDFWHTKSNWEFGGDMAVRLDQEKDQARADIADNFGDCHSELGYLRFDRYVGIRELSATTSTSHFLMDSIGVDHLSSSVVVSQAIKFTSTRRYRSFFSQKSNSSPTSPYDFMHASLPVTASAVDMIETTSDTIVFRWESREMAASVLGINLECISFGGHGFGSYCGFSWKCSDLSMVVVNFPVRNIVSLFNLKKRESCQPISLDACNMISLDFPEAKKKIVPSSTVPVSPKLLKLKTEMINVISVLHNACYYRIGSSSEKLVCQVQKASTAPDLLTVVKYLEVAASKFLQPWHSQSSFRDTSSTISAVALRLYALDRALLFNELVRENNNTPSSLSSEKTFRPLVYWVPRSFIGNFVNRPYYDSNIPLKKTCKIPADNVQFRLPMLHYPQSELLASARRTISEMKLSMSNVHAFSVDMLLNDIGIHGAAIDDELKFLANVELEKARTKKRQEMVAIQAEKEHNLSLLPSFELVSVPVKTAFDGTSASYFFAYNPSNRPSRGPTEVITKPFDFV